ncbi:uncharacterized protein LOC123504651 [Portunus trituberculatus]|uniref:uncharacterized protein LOC123504651 n=1 Tax=Portunus trituberculatus TaxID=210409 RepID=UPI001E1D18DB|nr:uncharacterized protein LOC123504651 [Portunus trituberculatus]
MHIRHAHTHTHHDTTLHTTTMGALHLALCLLALGTSSLLAVTRDTCLPSCPDACTPGEAVPDPHNCYKYYTCMENCEPTDVAFECPVGEKFDSVGKVCKTDDGTVTCGLCVAQCRYDCMLHKGFAAVRGVCNEYYFCATDTPVKIYCNDPKKPYFDGTNCVENENACCDPCEVYCEVPYTEIADPTSCKHFYYCDEIGFPLDVDRYECPEARLTVTGRTAVCLTQRQTVMSLVLRRPRQKDRQTDRQIERQKDR